MHQSFATTAPTGLGNSDDFDIYQCKARVCASFGVFPNVLKVPYNWAASWQNQVWLCTQRRLRSAQSDQSSLCTQWVAKDPILMWTAKTLIRLGGCQGWSESLLGTDDILLVLSWGGSVVNIGTYEIIAPVTTWVNGNAQAWRQRHRLLRKTA